MSDKSAEQLEASHQYALALNVAVQTHEAYGAFQDATKRGPLEDDIARLEQLRDERDAAAAELARVIDEYRRVHGLPAR